MKPYYDEPGITLYHGDCREVLPRLGNAADLVLTDPPYNVGMAYGQHNDSMLPEAYRDWCAEWFALVRADAPRTIIFPGHGNLPMWWSISKPSAVGCWYKPGESRSSHIGWAEWEPWFYWGQRLTGIPPSSVIRAPVGAEHAGNEHPCPKPVKLMRQLLTKAKSRVALDPFVGSGTTLRAAKDLGIRAIGIEVEERYCEIAVRRLGQEVLAVA